MDLEPIVVPPGWDAARDMAHFEEEGWPPTPSYRAALGHWLGFHHGNFVHAVRLSVDCILSRDPGLLPFEPKCLNTAERIALLLRWVQGSTCPSRCRPEILECLRACAFIEAERARLLADYGRAGEHAWLYPVVELAWRLGDCAAELEECLGYEDLGFGEFVRRWKEENF